MTANSRNTDPKLPAVRRRKETLLLHGGTRVNTDQPEVEAPEEAGLIEPSGPGHQPGRGAVPREQTVAEAP